MPSFAAIGSYDRHADNAAVRYEKPPNRLFHLPSVDAVSTLSVDEEPRNCNVS
jgi:hypothetical protein